MQSWRRLAGDNDKCGRCSRHPPQFDRARAFGLYEGSLRQIVHALKYGGHRSLGGPLAALMRQVDTDLLSSVDAVVPVPMHPWRRLRRGFNQADDLAQALGRPVWRALRRRSLGPPQSGLGIEGRRANVLDAYTLSLRDARSAARRPRHVVLVDDVMTTGATLDACSRVLRDAGVEGITALTLARTATAAPRGAALRLRQPPRRHPSAPHR